MENKHTQFRIVGFIYLVYSFLLMLGFTSLFLYWYRISDDVYVELLMVQSIFDKAMLSQIFMYAEPILKSGMIFSLFINLMAVLILQRKEWAVHIASWFTHLVIILVTALCVVGFINISDLLAPAKYHPEQLDYHVVVRFLRVILSMVAVSSFVISWYVNSKLRDLREMLND